MQNSQINRVIKLVRRTGDKVVLMDNESDAVLMLMDLAVYEKLLNNSPRVEDLTEEELMERINRDVAVWRASNDKERLEKTVDEVLEESHLRHSSVGIVPDQAVQTARTMPLQSVAQVSVPVQGPSTEESAADIVAEEGEEKFYLEPVE